MIKWRCTFKCWVGWLALSVAGGGCAMDLETGYKYRPLSASPTERRAYYASPYTPEAAAAQHEQSNENRFRRPGQ